MGILTVNAGSSTLKFSLYPVQGDAVAPQVLSGLIQGLEPGGAPRLDWQVRGEKHTRQVEANGQDPFAQALASLQQILESEPGLPPLRAVAHRVVHGGSQFTRSMRVDAAVLATLAELNPLAPLHQPNNLMGIRALQQAFPSLPQVACLDTAFHSTIDPLEARFALPTALAEQGIRRYGFHGLSYQYVIGALQGLTPRATGRVLMAHLGNGSSLCAASGGQSRATSMGFSAVDGLMMGTRSGTLDAGVLLYLLAHGWDHDRLEDLLYRQSGLLGVSGISADMRTLRANSSAAAALAIDLYQHRVVREAGAMVACVQGLDVLSFSGGIGENDALLRAEVCRQLAWMGVRLDEAANRSALATQPCAIHAADSAVEVWVVPTDEGIVCAREALALL